MPKKRIAAASRISTTAAKPACTAKRMSTAAPTNTNSSNSAATHSLLNLDDRRLETSSFLLCSTVPAAITANKPENPMAPWSVCSSSTSMKDRDRMMTTLPVSRIWTFVKKTDNTHPIAMPPAKPSRIALGSANNCAGA